MSHKTCMVLVSFWHVAIHFCTCICVHAWNINYRDLSLAENKQTNKPGSATPWRLLHVHECPTMHCVPIVARRVKLSSITLGECSVSWGECKRDGLNLGCKQKCCYLPSYCLVLLSAATNLMCWVLLWFTWFSCLYSWFLLSLGSVPMTWCVVLYVLCGSFYFIGM